MKSDGEVFAFVYNNRHGRGIVTAWRQENGRLCYMYAMTRDDESYLGLNPGLLASNDVAESVINQLTRRHWYVDIKVLASDVASELREFPDRWMPRGMCRLDDGSEHNPLYELPVGRHVVCCTLSSHIALRSPEGDGRARGWYAHREFERRAGLGYPQMALWQWEAVPGRMAADIVALCQKVVADPSPEPEFGVVRRESGCSAAEEPTESVEYSPLEKSGCMGRGP